MVLNESDIRSMVESCLKQILCEAAPIDAELDSKLRDIAIACARETQHLSGPEKKYLPLPDGWEQTDFDKENGIVGSKTLNFDGFPPIVLKVGAYGMGGAYDDENNEIFISVDPKEQPYRIYSTLYHEMIHYLDVNKFKMTRSGNGFDADQLPYTIPYCFRCIFYMLWNKFELRAYVYQGANNGYTYSKSNFDTLVYNYNECMKYKDNNKVWDTVADLVWGNRLDRRNTRNKFKKKTEYLLKKYYNLMRKQFKGEKYGFPTMEKYQKQNKGNGRR